MDLVYQGRTYPCPRPVGSYLFVEGAADPYLRVTDHPLGDSTVWLSCHSEMAFSDLLNALGFAELVDEPLESATGRPLSYY